MEINAKQVMDLRKASGAGMMVCKEALAACDCDIDKSLVYLREKGLASLGKRSERETTEGLVEAYIHFNGKVGVLVEIDCETDFVSRGDDFKAFAADVAMHIAAAAPECVSRDDVEADKVEAERQFLTQQAATEGKPENIVAKMVEGRMDKFYAEKCLLEQPFVKDDSKKVSDLLSELASKIGENIVIKRFARFNMAKRAEPWPVPAFGGYFSSLAGSRCSDERVTASIPSASTA